MSAGQPDNLDNDEETTNLYNFFIEKSKTAESPLKIKELCKEFQTATKSTLTINCLSNKIIEYRVKIHELEDMNEETKIRMAFALSAPIDNDFLIKIKENGKVETDNAQRITEYKKKDGGFELKGTHLYPSRKSQEKEKKMLEFLAKKSKDTNYVMTDTAFITDYQNYTKTSVSLSTLEHRYRTIRTHLHASTDFAEGTKVKMMFISGSVVSENYLKILEEYAEVELDFKNRITKYVAEDKSLKLKGEHSLSAKRRSEMRHRKKLNTTGNDILESDRKEEEKEKRDEKMTRSGRVSRKRVSSYGVLYDEIDYERKPSTSYRDIKILGDSINSNRKKAKIREESCERTIKIEDTGNSSNCQQESDPVSVPMNLESVKNEEDSSSAPIIQDIPMDFGTEVADSKLVDVHSLTLDSIGVGTIKTENNHKDVLNNNLLKTNVKTECKSNNMSSTGVTQDFISLHEFLKLLYSPVVTLNSVLLFIIQQKMKDKINELRHRDEEVPIEVIRSSLESCLYIVTKSAELSTKREEATPKLKDLLLILLMVTCYYDQSLYEFQRKLRNLINDLENQNKTVTMEKVRSAFETMLNIICH